MDLKEKLIEIENELNEVKKQLNTRNLCPVCGSDFQSDHAMKVHVASKHWKEVSDCLRKQRGGPVSLEGINLETMSVSESVPVKRKKSWKDKLNVDLAYKLIVIGVVLVVFGLVAMVLML